MKQNTYTAHDIERYHRGIMSPAEMHTLEKAALDDPFLADALEGYRNTQTATTDLALLQQKLQARIQKEKDKKRISFIGNNWMKIAALVILFAGGGWLMFQMLSGGNKKTELATSPALQEKTSTAPIEIHVDSTQVYSDAPMSNQATNKKVEQRKDISEEDNLIVSTSPRQKQAQTIPSTLSRQVTDSSQNQIYAHVEIMSQAKEKAYDSNSYRSNAFKKENNFSARVPGVKVDTIENLNVVLQSVPMADDEVVVVNKNKTVARQDAKRRMQITVDTLEPAEGWTNFGDYIATNMRAPEELEAKPLKGEVELSFEVNKQGEPVNITVVRSLCEKCDEEAVRLLKEGPKWKKNKKRGKVKFTF